MSHKCIELTLATFNPLASENYKKSDPSITLLVFGAKYILLRQNPEKNVDIDRLHIHPSVYHYSYEKKLKNVIYGTVLN